MFLVRVVRKFLSKEMKRKKRRRKKEKGEETSYLKKISLISISLRKIQIFFFFNLFFLEHLLSLAKINLHSMRICKSFAAKVSALLFLSNELISSSSTR